MASNANVGDLEFKNATTDITSLSLEMTNDDLIYVDFQCGDCGGELTEAVGDKSALTAKLSQAYISSDIDPSDLTLNFSYQLNDVDNSEMPGTAIANTDYSLENIMSVTGLDTNTGTAVIAVTPEYVIELDETINLALTTSKYIEATLPNNGNYTIKNDDYFEVSLSQLLIESDNDQTTDLTENQLDVSFCLPDGYSIPEGNSTLEFNISASVFEGIKTSSFKKATCADFALVEGFNEDDAAILKTCTGDLTSMQVSRTVNTEAITGETSCVSTAVLMVEDNDVTDQNRALKIALSAFDVRINPGEENITHERMIINEDVINLLDTGLTLSLIHI